MNQVTGQLSGIEARSAGWFAVHVQEEGRDWPIKLSTKRQELVGQAQQLMGQMVTALYNEQESTNINPHSGQPYINRYLEALSLAGQETNQQLAQIGIQAQQPQQSMQQPMQQQPVQQSIQNPQPHPSNPAPQPQVRQVDRQAEVQRIHRQSAAKVAVQLLPLVLQEGEQATLAGLLRISEALVQYFNEGVYWRVDAETAPPPERDAEQHSVHVPQGDGSTMAQVAEESNAAIGGMAPPLDPYGDEIPF